MSVTENGAPRRPSGIGVAGLDPQALRDWRLYRAKLTQDELALLSKISRGGISHLEHGRRHPSIEALRQLCWALGCQPGDLMAEPSQPTADLTPLGPGDADDRDSRLAEISAQTGWRTWTGAGRIIYARTPADQPLRIVRATTTDALATEIGRAAHTPHNPPQESDDPPQHDPGPMAGLPGG